MERSGAAQGIAELLVARGEPILTEAVIRLLPLGQHPKAGPREGLLWVFVFLPSCLGQAFAPLIVHALPAILQGLADDVEMVRDVALRSGQVIVKQHARSVRR